MKICIPELSFLYLQYVLGALMNVDVEILGNSILLLTLPPEPDIGRKSPSSK